MSRDGSSSLTAAATSLATVSGANPLLLNNHALIMEPATVLQISQFKAPEGQAPALVLADGSVYFGELEASSQLPHGLGVMLFKFDTKAAISPGAAGKHKVVGSEAFSAGDRYGGSWASGQFSGEGVLITATLTYQGAWSVGVAHGRGHAHYAKNYVDRMPDGSGSTGGGVGTLLLRGLSYLSPFDDATHKPKEYIGQHDRAHGRHGAGMMTYYDGDVYDGNWTNNRRDGVGKLRKTDGEIYEGNWEQDKRHGYGKIILPDGRMFKGVLVHDHRNGEGVLSFPNGDEYSGNFCNDRISGEGKMRYKNGDVYDGHWKDGKRDGKGKYTLRKTGAIINGSFATGLIHGAGKVEFPGVSLFVGAFDRGERVRGTMFWLEGAPEEFRDQWCYQGEWKGEHMQGQGLMWWRNGDFYYGHFVCSKRHGAGNMRYSGGGGEYSGHFAGNVRSGWGLEQAADGSIKAGLWVHDELVEGYIGEWDGKLLNGVGRLRLAVRSFLSGTNDIADAAAAASPTAPSTSSASPTCDRPLMEFFGIFKNGQRDGPGMLRLPALPGGVETLASSSKSPAVLASLSAGLKRGAATSDPSSRGVAGCGMHVIKGEWRGDVLECSRGVWTFPGGEVYAGGFRDGQRHGPAGYLWLPDGSVFAGEWKDHAPVGECMWFAKNDKDPIIHRADHERSNSKRRRSQAGASALMRGESGASTGGVRLPGLDLVLGLFWSNSSMSTRGAGDVNEGDNSTARVVVGYRDHYLMSGTWQRCIVPLSQYTRLVTPALRPFQSAVPTSMATHYSSLEAQECSDTAPWSSSGQREIKLVAPAVVLSGEVCGECVVTYPSGVQLRGRWLGSHPRLAIPHTPTSPYDAFMLRLKCIGLLPEAYVAPSEVYGGVDNAELLTTWRREAGHGPSRGDAGANFQAAFRACHSPLADSASKLLSARPHSGPESGDHQYCTFCRKEYGFFRKSGRCPLCVRSSCASCLTALDPTTVSRPDVLALISRSLQMQQWPQKGSDPESTSVTAVDLDSQSLASTPVCTDCARSVQKSMRLDTIWIPMSMFSSILNPYSSGRHSDNNVTPHRPEVQSSAPDDSPPPVIATDGDAHTHANPVAIRMQEPTITSNANDCVVYSGYTSSGTPHLWGEQWWGRTGYYVGEFKMGERRGLGVQVMSNGERYIGGFRRNEWHGVGFYLRDDGSVLHGCFCRGKLTEVHYHGELDEHLRRHGRGICCDPATGITYNGEWVHGVRHGTGTLQWPDGTVYSGDFVRGRVGGFGKLATPHSAFYGGFRNELRHGKGVEFFTELAVEGTWEDGVLHGSVSFFDGNMEEVYETTYCNGNERDDCFAVPIMIDDAQAQQCASCEAAFSLFLRRHHCRLCGKVFCDACSTRRAALPAHFSSRRDGDGDAGRGTTSNGIGASGQNQLQRVCDGCHQRLEQRRMIAIRRYRCGAVYAGCWSQGRWVSRGLYCRADGILLVMDSAGNPLLPRQQSSGECTSGGEKSASDKRANATGKETTALALQDATPSRAELDAYPSSSPQSHLDAFVLWWGSIAMHCKLHVLLNVPVLQRYQQLVSALQREAKGASHPSTVTAGSETAKVLAEWAAAHPPPRYPEAPAMAPLKLFVATGEEVSMNMERKAPGTFVGGEECWEAAVLRAARFTPAVMPRPPPAPSVKAASTCAQSDATSEEDSLLTSASSSTSLNPAAALAADGGDDASDDRVIPQAVSRRNAEASLPRAPALSHHDISDEELLTTIRRERVERFTPAGAGAAPTLSCYAYKPLLPATPKMPPHGTNQEVAWDTWGLCPVPRYQSRSCSDHSGVRRRAVEEGSVYFACPLWPPTVPDAQQLLEDGKFAMAQELMWRIDAEASAGGRRSDEGDSSATLEVSAGSDSDSEGEIGDACNQVMRVCTACGAGSVLAIPPSADQACQHGCDGVLKETKKKRKAKRRGDKKKDKRNVGSRAAVDGGGGWLPAPLRGPYRLIATVTAEEGARGAITVRQLEIKE